MDIIWENDAELWQVLFDAQPRAQHMLEGDREPFINDWMSLGHSIGERRRMNKAIEDVQRILNELR